MDNYEYDYLAHHGIKGQKWGVRRTPEQLGHRSALKEKAKSAGKALKKAGTAAGKTLKKVGKKAGKVAGKAGKAAGDFASDQYAKHKRRKKEKLMNQLIADPTQIYKYRKQLSQRDVDEIFKQVDMNRRIRELQRANIERGYTSINKSLNSFSNAMQTVANVTKNTRSAYQNTAALYNGIIDVMEGAGKWSKGSHDRLTMMGSYGTDGGGSSKKPKKYRVIS